MRTPPTDLDRDELAWFVDERWSLGRVELTYAPVGFGSHHWIAETSSGRRFVTVDDVRGPHGDERADDLHRAMRVARTLSRAVPQAVAPLPGRAGEVVQRLEPGFAVTVFDLHDAPALHDWGPGDRHATVELLARVHAQTESVGRIAAEERFVLPGRDAVGEALEGLDGPTDWWMTGPYALPTRQLLIRGAEVLRAALADHNGLAERLNSTRSRWVITHGEPHARNLLTRAGELLLVDWDTARLAPAARDLWHVDAGSGEQVRHYRALTGREVPREDVEFYRLRWDLQDVCSYVEWFTTAHTATSDAEIGWSGLVDAFEALERRYAGRT